MKFCDKLQKIRKENNITQEGLADRLGVSRQAVSKWESGTAYPDTEKLIQISKLFNVSLDELINDSKEVNKQVDNKKIKFNEVFDMVLNFISNTFNMFMAMKFKEKVKLLFEMALLLVFLLLAGVFINEVIITLIRKMFMFLPTRILNGMIDFVDAIIYIGLIIIDVIVFVRVLKIRYLDYYVVIKDDSVDKVVTEEPIPELKDKKDYKLVIRDPEDSRYNIFRIIGKICLFGFKILGFIILLPIVIAFILLVMALVISFSTFFLGLFFNGISLIILGSLIVVYLVIEFIFDLVFNRKLSLKRIFLMFVLGLFTMGVGLGIAVIGFASFETEKMITVMDNRKTVEIDYDDKLVIPDIMTIDSDKIVIDNSLENIKLDVLTDKYSNVVVSKRVTYNAGKEEGYIDVDFYTDSDEYKILKDVYNKFKDKKLVSFDDYAYSYKIDKVYISEANLTKIKENYDKIYE